MYYEHKGKQYEIRKSKVLPKGEWEWGYRIVGPKSTYRWAWATKKDVIYILMGL